ncbi:MAG: hypothetical protein SGJ04_03845 [Bacteroidota bacterium]|nr:hypothetical protein [Bacteroidota bacterium]
MLKSLSKISLLLFFILLGSYPGSAQGVEEDEDLARQYYSQGEYAKANSLFKKVWDKRKDNFTDYDKYLNGLIQVKEFKTASKELKRHIPKQDNLMRNYIRIDLAHLEKLSGNENDFKRILNGIKQDLTDNSTTITDYVARLINWEYFSQAAEFIEKYRQVSGNSKAMSGDLADIYKRNKDYAGVVNEYIQLAVSYPYQLEAIELSLAEIVQEEAGYNELRKQLLKGIQSDPNNIIYPDLLTWLYLERKDYESAYIQAKALDNRQKFGGYRLVTLAYKVAESGDYEFANKIFQYVVDMGSSARYYQSARKGQLDIQYKRITQTTNFTKLDVENLEKNYNEVLNEIGLLSQEGGEIVLKLAEIKAQYSNNIQGAITLLKDYISHPNLNKEQYASARLALGDYSIMTGEVWDATLYYEQVAKEYKDDELGHEAKFRNAKLSFYRGEFEWAKAQLDVLKSSTSELIANDAMQLALTIQDILGLDSNQRPLYLYAQADLYSFKGIYATANAYLDSLQREFPTHALTDEALMERANIAVKKKDFATALGYYEKVYSEHAKDILADDALYKAAIIFEVTLKDKITAMSLYERLLLEHKGSVYGVDARNRYRILRGDKIN